MQKYVVRPQIPAEAHAELADHPELVRHLLFHRGITDAQSAADFVRPNYDAHMHDPALLKDIDKAVERILAAIAGGEKIIVFSDYDADGIPGAVIAHDFFTKIGYKNFSIYIPHRHDEGFGLNHEAIEQFVADGAKLLITIDCGVADGEEIARAQAAGLDVIITDHHELPNGRPPAYAVVDPKQDDCQYPNKCICGAALFYKVAQAVLAKQSFGVKPGTEKWWLDMAGIATLSDMVPLTGENRIFAHYGLTVLRKSRRPGLQALLKAVKVDQTNLTEDDIAFMVTPRINAASRMGLPMDAFSLLSADDPARAHELASHLNAINDERKGVVASIVKEVRHHLSELYPTDADVPPLIVTGNPNWKPALLGLVANSLVETYRRPVFLWGREGGSTLKGSCRSNGVVSVLDIMQQAAHAFEQFGGHHQSGGFSVHNDHIHTLTETLINAFNANEAAPTVAEPSCIDAALSLAEVTPYTWSQISKLQPFGVGNPKPLFLFRNVKVTRVETFGKQKNHLKITCSDETTPGVSAIAFFSSAESFEAPLHVGAEVCLLGNMELSTFGRREIRIRIAAILPAHAL
jgi:single-stranded-DNA-specific exonuclease